jgi:hypothetical protein
VGRCQEKTIVWEPGRIILRDRLASPHVENPCAAFMSAYGSCPDNSTALLAPSRARRWSE